MKTRTPQGQEFLFIFRPTPSRRLSLIRGPRIFPRPRAWDVRAVVNPRLRAALRFACLFPFRVAHSLRSFAFAVRFAGGAWRWAIRAVFPCSVSCYPWAVGVMSDAPDVCGCGVVAGCRRIDVMGGVAMAGVAGIAVGGSLGDFGERA